MRAPAARVTPAADLGQNVGVPAGHSEPNPGRSRWERVYGVVRRIPSGRVATYGQVARLAGLAGQARQVGYALHAAGPERRLPWHRVLNARGEISPRATPGFDGLQRQLLEREGICFDGGGRVCLARFGWRPRRP